MIIQFYIHSLILQFSHWSVHSFIHPSIHSFIHSFIYSWKTKLYFYNQTQMVSFSLHSLAVYFLFTTQRIWKARICRQFRVGCHFNDRPTQCPLLSLLRRRALPRPHLQRHYQPQDRVLHVRSRCAKSDVVVPHTSYLLDSSTPTGQNYTRSVLATLLGSI